MQKALQRHQSNQARVIPIILRPVYWEDAPFAHLQVLPTEARPATRWTTLDDAFDDVTRGIRKVTQDLQTLRKTKEGTVLRDLKRYEEVLVAYEEAIRLNSTYAYAYNNKAWFLMNSKDMKRL